MNEPPWWEEYGIDPSELSAPIEASLVGDDVGRALNEDVNQALRDVLTRFLSRPEIRQMNRVGQALAAAAVGTSFRGVGSMVEEQFTAVAEQLERGDQSD